MTEVSLWGWALLIWSGGEGEPLKIFEQETESIRGIIWKGGSISGAWIGMVWVRKMGSHHTRFPVILLPHGSWSHRSPTGSFSQNSLSPPPLSPCSPSSLSLLSVYPTVSYRIPTPSVCRTDPGADDVRVGAEWSAEGPPVQIPLRRGGKASWETCLSSWVLKEEG